MAGNGGRVTLGVGFNSDISGLNQPLQAIQKIRDSLKEIRTINIKIATAGKAPEEAAKLKKELLEAQDAAKIAGTALQKSFNTKLNTINVTSFNNELRKSNINITELGQKLSKAGISGQAAFRNIVAQISKSHVTIKKTNALLDEMKTTMMNSVKWGITSAIWNNMTGSIEKAWGFAKKLDSSLNDIRIVTDKSAEDMEKFAVQANKAAKSLGSSTTGYTNASLIYYQQGLSDAEVQARTETTLKAANVTGQSAADVSEQLTAVWNGYKVSANEAELYIDKLSAVAATTAADLEELSTGMSKVASAANIMGVDIDQLNAQLATVVSVTRQAPESVGTAFKTIYARMGDIEAGLDTETSLGEYTKRMNEMGFNVLDTNGKLRDMGSVIEEIGNKWTSLSREQQVALSQTMAGTRQYNNLLALFDNWDEYTESLETSREAAGSLQKQQDIYMESMEAHLQQLSTEGERVYNNLFNADAANPLIDTLTRLVSIIGDAVGGLGGIGPIIMSLGAIFTQVFSKQIGSSITTTFLNMKNAKKDIAELKESIATLQKAGEGTTNQATKQIAKMGQDVNNFALKGIITQEQADELQSYINKLDELQNIQEELNAQQEQYQGAVNDSINKMDQSGIKPEVASAQFQKMEEQAEKDGADYSELEGEELEAALQKNDAYKEFTEIIEKQREKLDKAADSADKYAKSLASAERIGNAQESANQSPDRYDRFIQDKTKSLIKEIQTSDNESIKKNEALKAAIEKYQKRLQENGGKMSKEAREAAKEIATAYQTQVEEMTRNLDEATETARRTAMGEGRDISQGLQDVDAGKERVVDDYNEATSDINLEEKISAITQLVGAFGGLFAAINNIVNILQVWNNEELTGPEKLKQTISGLIVAIPIFVASLQAVDKGLMSVAGKSLFGVGGLLAFKGAEDGASASAIFLQGTLLPIIAIVAGVIAVLTAGVAIFNAVSDAYNADAIAAEKAAQAYEEATQAVTEANTAYENLKNTIDKYDSAIEKMKNLASGTDAFKESMEEANSQAKDLINTYGILSDQYFYNAQGAITFKDGVLEALENQKKEQIAIAERQATIAKWESQKATAKSNKTNTVRAIQNDTGVYGGLENTGWEWLETVNRIIRGIGTLGLSEAALHIRTTSGALGGFNEDMLDEVVAAIEKNDLANGKLTDAVLDSLPYSQQQKNALKENSKAIEQLVASNKQLSDSQKNEFENLIRQSLQNNKTFNSMDASSQNYLIELISNKYGSYEEFQKQNNYDEILKSFEEEDLENLGSMYAELKGQSGAKVENGEVKLYNEQGQLTDISYTKEQMAAELASEQLLNEMSDIMLPFVDVVEDVSKKEADILGKDVGLFSQYLSSGEIDISNMSSKEYSQLLKLLNDGDNTLEKFFNNIDLSGTNFNSASEAMEKFREQVKLTNFSSIFEKEQSEAAENVTKGNAIIDKLLKGDSLSEDDLKVLSSLQNKYETLQGIWVEELWYNQENITKLKAVLEVEEDIISASKNIEAQWQNMSTAQNKYNDSLKSYEDRKRKSLDIDAQLADIDRQRKEIEKYRLDPSTLQSFSLLKSNTAKPNENGAPVAQGAKYTSLAEDLQTFAQNENIDISNVNSTYLQDVLGTFSTNVQNALNNGTDSISALNGAIDILTQDVQNTDSEISADAKAAKESALAIVQKYSDEYASYISEEEKYNTANDKLKDLDTEYASLKEEQKVAMAQEEKDLDTIFEDLQTYEKSIQDFLTMDLEIRIANKEDLLTDVDNVIDRAQNIKTAIESIGDGFKVAADKSDELLRIFPELAAGAKVLSDGTIELNELTVDSVLDGEADILDADRNKTVAILQNRIKELDLSIEADKKQLEEVQNTAAEEFNIQDYLNDTYKDFTSDEIQADTTQAQSEIANDGISTKAIINNWEQKSLAAAKYAEIAAAAISDPASVAEKNKDFSEYQAKVKIDEDFSSVDSNLTDEEKEKRIAERNERIKKRFEEYLQQRIDLSEQERAEYLLAISDIYSGQNDIAEATKENIDLLKDEIDRYHDINIQLEQINRQLDRLQKTREHLTGKTLIKNYNEEIKLLQKQIKLSKEKQKIQLEEAKELKGQLLTFGVTFNDDNTVANYAEIMAKYIKEVNAAKASGDEDAAKAAEERYEYFKKNFERYEELVNSEMPDLIDEITELGYQKISQKIEKFNTTLQVELDTRQAKRDWKDFLKEMTVTDTDYSGQASYLKSDTSSKLKDLESTQKAFEKSNKALENGIALATGAADAATTKSRYYDAKTGVFDGAAAQEETQNYISSLTELSLNIKENMTALGQTFLDTLDQANEKIQDALDGYDDINNALNHGIKLQQLFNGEDDYAGMADYYSDIVTNTNQQIKLLSQNRDRLADEIVKYSQDVENAEKTLEDAKKSGDAYAIATAQNNYDLAKQALDSTYDAWVDTTENLYSTIETQYENLKNQYLNDVNKILDEITKQLTGGASLSYLSDEWDLINKSADKYLDTVNATYEVQTLEGKYLKSINNTTSISAQKKLNKVMDEELESLREKDKLTQYDIDRANKKYELTLKQIALEEAQNNKSSMRLRRDAQGNYSYQFVADEDAISDAEQEVAAAENDLYNFDKEQYQNTLNEALTLYSEWQQKLKEAAEINDPEERAKKEAMINKYYQDMIYQTVSDNTTAQQNLQSSAFGALSGMYATNLTNFEAMTDGMFGDFSKFTIEDMPSLLAQMVAGYDGSIQQMVNAMGNEEEGFIAISNKAFTDLIDSAGTFDSAVTTLRSNLEENGGAIRDDINKTKLLIDKTKGAADNLVSSLSVVIGDQYKTVRDGLTKLGNKYIEVGKQIEAARTNAQNLLSTLNTLNGTKVNPQVPTIDANPTAVPTFGSSGGSSTDSVSGAGTEEEDKYIGTVITWKKKIYPWKYKDSGGKPISLSMAELWGEEIEGLSRGRHPQELQTAMKNAKIEWEVLRKDGGRDSNSYLLQNKQTGAYAHIETSRIASLDTGGYTGEWGAEGRMAMLHEKEIVLNKMDTENILNAVSIVRGLDNMVSKLGATFLSGMTSLKIPNIVSTENNNSTAQTVNITAKFPDVTSAVEIEKALKNLVNIASQRAQSVK